MRSVIFVFPPPEAGETQINSAFGTLPEFSCQQPFAVIKYSIEARRLIGKISEMKKQEVR